MGNKDQKRQKQLAKKVAKRKDKAKAIRLENQVPSFKQSENWPILECLMSSSWEDPMQLTQIVIARKNVTSPHVAAGTFLVDLACLGLKNADSQVLASESSYRGNIIKGLFSDQDYIKCSLEFAAKVIHTGIEYSGKLGFRPHKDFALASIIIGNANINLAEENIPTGGPEGKPYFIQGYRDDAVRIINILNQSVGEGNYNYLQVIGDPGDLMFDEEDIFASDYSDDVVEFECTKCGTIFETEVGEVTVNVDTLRPEFEYDIICPQCGKLTINDLLLTETGQGQLTALTMDF